MVCSSNIIYYVLVLSTGFLGALDPYKHRVNLGQIEMSRDSGNVLSESKAEVDPEQGIVYTLCIYMLSETMRKRLFELCLFGELVLNIRQKT